MPVRADYHLHSSFSGDSDAPMESMIQRAGELGLERLCFTEHMDFEYPVSPDTPEGLFEVDTDAYYHRFRKIRASHHHPPRLFFGIELGLQSHLAERQAAYTAARPFDFIIGSSHLCHGMDPCQGVPFWEGRSEEEACREYFSSILENLESFTDFDVYGHLDYVIRYAPEKDRNYTYEKYQDLFERIIDLLLEKGIGLEVNTGSIRHGLKELHPCSRILKRYRQKGGQIVTVGSDAHCPEDLCRGFDLAEKYLTDCGFTHYTVFEQRKPLFVKL